MPVGGLEWIGSKMQSAAILKTTLRIRNRHFKSQIFSIPYGALVYIFTTLNATAVWAKMP